MGPTSYRLTSLLPMLIDPPIPEIQLFQNLTLKIQGQGHGNGQSSKPQSGSHFLSIHIAFVPCQLALLFLWSGFFNIWPWNPRSGSLAQDVAQLQVWTIPQIFKWCKFMQKFQSYVFRKFWTQIWQVFGSWANPYGANGQMIMMPHNFRLKNNSTELQTEKIRPAASETCIPKVWQTPAHTSTPIPLQLRRLRGNNSINLMHALSLRIMSNGIQITIMVSIQILGCLFH